MPGRIFLTQRAAPVVDLPEELRRRFPGDCDEVVNVWWRELSDNDRQRVVEMWDERYEARFFTPQADEAGQLDIWDQVPPVKGGRFMPRQEDPWAEWLPGYLEYMLQHPEFYMVMDEEHFIVGGTYTCSQHPAAQSCLQQGSVARDFQCPLHDTACPMARLRGAKLTKVQDRSIA